MDRQVKDYSRLNNSGVSSNGDVFEPSSSNNAKQRASLVEWLNSVLPDLNLPINASDEELRTFLVDGTVLCRLVNKLKPGSVAECGNSVSSSQSQVENVQRFLSAMDQIGLPRFQVTDLEKGSMKIVLDCLLTLQTQFMPNVVRSNGTDASSRSKVFGERPVNYVSQKEESFRLLSSPSFGEDRKSDFKYQRGLRSPVMAEPSAAVLHHGGHKFHEVFQLKQGSYTDIPAAKITEMMKSNSLDNAPTQSLLSVVNGILDESIERKNGEIPHRVACLLRKVVQEIERRIATQAEHLRTQNNLFKAREEKYQSRIRVLEALATGTSEETQIVMNQLQQIKSEKNKIEEKKKSEEQDAAKATNKSDDHNQEIAALKKELELVRKMMKENNDHNKEISALKQELEVARKKMKENDNQEEEAALKQELETARTRIKENEHHKQEIEALKHELERSQRMVNENGDRDQKIVALKRELEAANKTKEDTRGAQQDLERKLKEVESQLTESMKQGKELEALSESRSELWNKKEHIYQIFTEFQLGALRELRFASQSIRQEIVRTEKSYSEEFSTLGSRIRVLDDAAKSYYSLLNENRKLHNELQELKGNIRVYCRVRPFLPGQKGKQSFVEYIGENGELIVMNPSKQGKEGRRSFKFDKVYGPPTTQAEVYSDTQPLIQSVLDGYNVCIFAYGQTGSGKTYTMTGPNKATEDEWGVNYRALTDLFRISQSRESSFKYEVSVQMVEIYNEQVRDLLSSDSSQKKIGILSATRTNGLAVPDANILPVNSTSDVLKLMDSGLKNRAQASTSMNERSSRSHSIVSIHVRGTDLKTGSTLRGSLHLVDLAGSERVDRSEVTGDRLKEAQHINKSLSALGDVIFALAQKSAHIPYRNSKLTQVLQSSLGGQAKTLMFVQLNPDNDSFMESLSTLKFAERVSGVELGAAKSSKDGRDVRELMEQVASLKDTIAKKDEEIDRLHDKSGTNSLRYGSTSPDDSTPQRSLKLSGGKGSENSASDHEDCSEGTEGSPESSRVLDEAKLRPDSEKTKSLPRIPRTQLKLVRESPKGSNCMTKSSSTSNLSTKTAAKRWH